ncbi:MAG: hypothetical protein OJI67_07830 [Prosthecobacter sp.]|nr:hypothetical protein [Prosthecobacter sp.]
MKLLLLCLLTLATSVMARIGESRDNCIKTKGWLALSYDYQTSREWLLANRSNITDYITIITADRVQREADERARQKQVPNANLDGF